MTPGSLGWATGGGGRIVVHFTKMSHGKRAGFVKQGDNSFIQSFIPQIHIEGPLCCRVVDTGDKALNKTDKNSCLYGLSILARGGSQCQMVKRGMEGKGRKRNRKWGFNYFSGWSSKIWMRR